MLQNYAGIIGLGLSTAGLHVTTQGHTPPSNEPHNLLRLKKFSGYHLPSQTQLYLPLLEILYNGNHFGTALKLQ